MMASYRQSRDLDVFYEGGSNSEAFAQELNEMAEDIDRLDAMLYRGKQMMKLPLSFRSTSAEHSAAALSIWIIRFLFICPRCEGYSCWQAE